MNTKYAYKCIEAIKMYHKYVWIGLKLENGNRLQSADFNVGISFSISQKDWMSDPKRLVICELLSRLQHVKTQYENIEAKVRRRFHAIEKFSLRNAFVSNFFMVLYILLLYQILQLILAYCLSISRQNYLAAKKSF